jgi:hypothetical protein
MVVANWVGEAGEKEVAGWVGEAGEDMVVAK